MVDLSSDENMWDSVFKHKSFEFDGEIQAQVFHEQVQYFYRSRELDLEFKRNISQRREFEIADSKLISSAICLDETLSTYIPLLPFKSPDVSSSSNEKADPIMYGSSPAPTRIAPLS